jgi:N-dimethylarginine dimethylaminohydrolase
VNRATPALAKTLARKGFEVVQTPLSEFMKAGGSAKCLTLRLNE